MIEIKNLNKKFGKLNVLNNVSVTANKGECIALIGPNGCGKTTLIKSFLGMVVPDSGSIEFDGASVLGEYHYRNRIGYMPQIGRYPDNMTIGQVFEMVQEIRQNQDVDKELYEAFKIEELANKKKEKGKLILITSHLLSELDDLVSQIIFMQEGVIEFHKPVQQLKDETQETKLSKAISKVLKSTQKS